MYKETEQTVASTPSAGYVSPSVRVIALKTSRAIAILAVSTPADMTGKDAF